MVRRAGGTAPGSGGVGGISPDVTWDSGYTEAPDETAHGDYMKLMASAGLAFDRVHLEYLAKGKLRINRTEREQGGQGDVDASNGCGRICRHRNQNHLDQARQQAAATIGSVTEGFRP